jgi:hypothetical protein
MISGRHAREGRTGMTEAEQTESSYDGLMQDKPGAGGKDEEGGVFTRIQARIDKMVTVNMAMWELLKERTDLSEQDLLAKVDQIVARGGRPSSEGKKCGQCGRPISSQHHKCLYCGAEEKDRDAFDLAR